MNHSQYFEEDLKNQNKAQINFFYIIKVSFGVALFFSVTSWLVFHVIFGLESYELAIFLIFVLVLPIILFFCELSRVRGLKRELGIK